MVVRSGKAGVRPILAALVNGDAASKTPARAAAGKKALVFVFRIAMVLLLTSDYSRKLLAVGPEA